MYKLYVHMYVCMYFYKKLTCDDFLTGSPTLSKRQKIVNEIYSSEQSYISQLSVIIDVSLQEHPCMDVNRGVPRAFISKLSTVYMSACVCMCTLQTYAHVWVLMYIPTYLHNMDVCGYVGISFMTEIPSGSSWIRVQMEHCPLA